MSDSLFVPGAAKPLQAINPQMDDPLAMVAKALHSRSDECATSGACMHIVNGVDLLADPAGIVWWEAQKTLLVADLHLEKGSSFARRGQMLPPYDTLATLKRLQSVIEKYLPQRVIALGDSFHDVEASGRLPLPATRQLAEMMRGREWLWITGNHDPDPPRGLGGDVAHEYRADGLILRHEPKQDDCLGEIAGHLHPKARIVARGRSVRRSCFAASAGRMILPSFGAYTGGLDVFHHAFSGLFEGRDFHALMRGDDRVYRVAAVNLRKSAY